MLDGHARLSPAVLMETHTFAPPTTEDPADPMWPFYTSGKGAAAGKSSSGNLSPSTASASRDKPAPQKRMHDAELAGIDEQGKVRPCGTYWNSELRFLPTSLAGPVL